MVGFKNWILWCFNKLLIIRSNFYYCLALNFASLLKNNDIFPLNYKKMYPLITSGEIAFDLNQYKWASINQHPSDEI